MRTAWISSLAGPPTERVQRTRRPVRGLASCTGGRVIRWQQTLMTLMLVQATVAFGVTDPASWPEFAPPGGRFAIRMPGEPSEQFDSQSGVHNFQVVQGEKSWVAGFVILAPELRRQPESLLDQIQAGFLRLFPESKLVSSTRTKIGGFPGITCVIEAKASGRPEFKLSMNAVATEDRIITFGFISRKDEFVESDAAKYIASFRLK